MEARNEGHNFEKEKHISYEGKSMSVYEVIGCVENSKQILMLEREEPKNDEVEEKKLIKY